MTAITFPTDPANDELYTAPNGTVYIWDGEKWVVNSTIYTGPALENLSQDRVAPMFVNGVNTGITFAYNATTNVMTTSVADSDRLVNGAHTVSLGANGVLTLADGSIINGATLKTIAGNYAGITAGPASPAGKDEDSWMWVDNNGATIATKYSTDAHTWTFNNSGALTFPQGTTIATADGTDAFIIDGAVDKDIQIYTYSGPTPTAHGWTFGASGLTTFPSFTVDNVDQGENLFIQGPEIGSANSLIGISAKDDVIITSNILTSPKVWTFGTTGNLSYPNTALQRDTGTVTCAGNASTVVYTASGQYQHTIRLLIQVEGSEGAPEGWDTQACEMIIAKSWRADDIAATVYGIVHTSVAPLATFSAEWNALTSRVQVLCATPSANSVYVRTFATEITTAD